MSDLAQLDLQLPLNRPRDYNPRKAQADVFYVEQKWDGHWTRITTLGAGKRAHTRRIDTLTGEYRYLDVSRDLLDKWAPDLPPDTALDGELIWPGHPASDVVTALTTDPSVLEYRVFSSPMIELKAQDTALYQAGRAALARLVNLEVSCPLVHVYRHVPSREEVLDLHDRLGGQAVSEGLVLKGYWYADWWKVKPTHTVDCVVTAVNVSIRGRHMGKCRSLQVAVYDEQGALKDLGAVSGMDDEVRYAITEAAVGRVCEVEYDCLAGRGRLRFPRFLQWRDDKAPHECRVDQLPE